MSTWLAGSSRRIFGRNEIVNVVCILNKHRQKKEHPAIKTTLPLLAALLLAALSACRISRNPDTTESEGFRACEEAPVPGSLPVRVDNVSRPAVLLAKFSFDKSQVLEDWKLENFKAGMEPSELTIDPDDPHSGAASLKFWMNSGTNAQHYITSSISLAGGRTAAGDRIRVRFFARTDAAKCEVSFQLLEKDAQKVLGWTRLDNKQDKVLIDRGPVWAEYTAEGAPRAGTEKLTVFVTLAKTATGRTVWIDDLSIEELSGGVK